MGSTWKTTKRKTKAGWDKAWGWFEKASPRINRWTNKIGSEAFMPMTLERESEKGARILKSFCRDGFYKTDEPSSKDGPNGEPIVLFTIPRGVIQNCVGLAIFSTFRVGLHWSGSGGSGVLIAKLPDGSWSPPSGILIHTVGVGLVIGVDIYDCVVVLNNQKALDAFSKLRVTVGGEVSATAGPIGTGGTLEANVDLRKGQDHEPIFTYMKSRGLYIGLQLDGTLIFERTDENARFYGERIGVRDILAGKVKNVPDSVRSLIEVAKSAEGRTDVDQGVYQDVNSYATPGNLEVEEYQEETEEVEEGYADDSYGYQDADSYGAAREREVEESPEETDEQQEGYGYATYGYQNVHSYPASGETDDEYGYANYR